MRRDIDENPLEKLKRMGMKLVGFFFFFIIIVAITEFADCYGFVPHGPWFVKEEPEHKPKTQTELYEDCVYNCKGKSNPKDAKEYTDCLAACQKIYKPGSKKVAKKKEKP
jgi:hypothetical protein